MRRFPAVLLVAWGVIASGCSTAPESKPTVQIEFVRPTVPAAARQPCEDPVTLPDRDLGAAEVTSFWNRDRVALRVCEPRRAAAVAAIEGAKP